MAEGRWPGVLSGHKPRSHEPPWPFTIAHKTLNPNHGHHWTAGFIGFFASPKHHSADRQQGKAPDFNQTHRPSATTANLDNRRHPNHDPLKNNKAGLPLRQLFAVDFCSFLRPTPL